MDLGIYNDAKSKHYFSALEYLKKIGKIKSIDYVFLKDLVSKPYTIPRLKTLSNKERIILGMAPYNPLVHYFNSSKFKDIIDNTIYHTSWPYWDQGLYRWPALSITKQAWKSFLKSHKTVAVSKAAERTIQTLCPQVHRIPHSVDTTIFHPRKKDSSTFNVLFVGNMIESKGVLDIINIAKKMSNLHICFHFVGDGPLAKTVANYSKKIPVHYRGYISNAKKLSHIYSECDLLILPSHSTRKNPAGELFGIVILEAMSCGLPVIAADHIGPREIISNKKTGYLVKQQDISTMVDRIKQLYESPELSKKMGMCGREIILKKYELKLVANMWWNLLEDSPAKIKIPNRPNDWVFHT